MIGGAKMLTLTIISSTGKSLGEWRGLQIDAEFEGKLSAGDRIKVLADGC